MDWYSCKLDTREQLTIYSPDDIRWLDTASDFPKIESYYAKALGATIRKADFDEARWKVCALLQNGEILCFAGVLFMTDKNWEIGAVSTHPHHRGQGFAKRVCAFAARYILENGRQATCNTAADNFAMQAVMRAIGMQKQ